MASTKVKSKLPLAAAITGTTSTCSTTTGSSSKQQNLLSFFQRQTGAAANVTKTTSKTTTANQNQALKRRRQDDGIRSKKSSSLLGVLTTTNINSKENQHTKNINMNDDNDDSMDDSSDDDDDAPLSSLAAVTKTTKSTGAAPSSSSNNKRRRPTTTTNMNSATSWRPKATKTGAPSSGGGVLQLRKVNGKDKQQPTQQQKIFLKPPKLAAATVALIRALPIPPKKKRAKNQLKTAPSSTESATKAQDFTTLITLSAASTADSLRTTIKKERTSNESLPASKLPKAATTATPLPPTKKKSKNESRTTPSSTMHNNVQRGSVLWAAVTTKPSAKVPDSSTATSKKGGGNSNESLDTAMEFLQPKRRKQQQKRKANNNTETTTKATKRQPSSSNSSTNDLTLQDIREQLGTTNETDPQAKTKTTIKEPTISIAISLGNAVGNCELTAAPPQSVSNKRKNAFPVLDDLEDYDDDDAAEEQAVAKELQPYPRKSQNLVHQLYDRNVLGSRGRTPWRGPTLSQLSTTMSSLSLSTDSVINSEKPAAVPRITIAAKPASWINLGTTSRETSTITACIDCMAWDPLGVLLAVAQTCCFTKQGWIEIYDWDTVCAADRQGRSARVRAQAAAGGGADVGQQLRLDIPPILRFRVPSPTSSSGSSSGSSRRTQWMRWNPHHPDQLAVASRCGSVVYCLNISHVDEALATTPADRIMKPPRHSYWEFRPKSQDSMTTASSCVFVAKDHIVAAFGASLHCWRYCPKRDPTSIQPKLKWVHPFPFQKTSSSLSQVSIGSLETLGKEHLVVGSSRGHLALIQWKRIVVAKSVSSFSIVASTKVSSPTVLCQWQAHASLATIPPEHVLDSSIMGIQQLRIESDFLPKPSNIKATIKSGSKTPAAEQKEYEQLCGRFCLQWVTRCGWVMEVTLAASPSPHKSWDGYKVRRGKPRILWRTPPVRAKPASGGPVSIRQNEWSMPTKSVATDSSENFLCWQNVPSLTRVLAHQDQRVLADQPSLIRDLNESYTFNLKVRVAACSSKNASGDFAEDVPPDNLRSSAHSLKLPKRRGQPTLISVEPQNQEWAIVATDTEQLYVVSLRSKRS